MLLQHSSDPPDPVPHDVEEPLGSPVRGCQWRPVLGGHHVWPRWYWSLGAHVTHGGRHLGGHYHSHVGCAGDHA